ncbi:MAG TPA: hypothetical protein VM618_02935, partial [Acidimicrobiia bacterium]|nr:hypothetical protein [Acidimicrobiia bacterium]
HEDRPAAHRPHVATIAVVTPSAEAAIPMVASLAAAPTSGFRLRLLAADGAHRAQLDPGDADVVVFDAACGDVAATTRHFARTMPATAVVVVTSASDPPWVWDVAYADGHLERDRVSPALVELVIRQAMERRRFARRLAALMTADAGREARATSAFPSRRHCVQHGTPTKEQQR